MLVKVCGMRDADNIREVDALRPDFMGFIFHEPSPRCVRAVPSCLPSNARRTGVFVDRDFDFIMDRVRAFGLSCVQLHGSESPSLLRELKNRGLMVLKAVSVGSQDDIRSTVRYEDCCDLFVFDTRCPSAGGSGRQFDWTLLKLYCGSVPFLLSGGIGPDTDISSFSHPKLAGYDLNSRFETSPGIKDPELLREFIRKIRHQ